MFSAPNYTQTPNEFFDDIAATLKEGELRVLLVIIRQTFGWRKDYDRISLSQMQRKTGMCRDAVINAIKSLIDKKLIEKRKVGENGTQKVFYSICAESPKKDEEFESDGVEDFDDFIDDSNISYRSSKTTPTSRLKRPTKETLTKEINKKISKEIQKKKEKPAAPVHEPSRDSELLYNLFIASLRKRNPGFREPNKSKWTQDFDRMIQIDKRSVEEIAKVIEWSETHKWWRKACLSPEKLRHSFDEMQTQKGMEIQDHKVEANRAYVNVIKQKFPEALKSLIITSKYVMNSSTSKELSLEMDTQAFQTAFVSMFGGRNV